MPHGGKREGAGRKPKIEELKLIERLDAVINEEDAIKKLSELIKANNFNALKLYFEYRYGKPKEDVTTTHNFEDFDIKEALRFDKP
jgi:hypothetical protein